MQFPSIKKERKSFKNNSMIPAVIIDGPMHRASNQTKASNHAQITPTPQFDTFLALYFIGSRSFWCLAGGYEKKK